MWGHATFLTLLLAWLGSYELTSMNLDFEELETLTFGEKILLCRNYHNKIFVAQLIDETFFCCASLDNLRGCVVIHDGARWHARVLYAIKTKIKSFDENGQEIEEYVYFMPKGNGGLGGTFIIGEGDRSKNQHHFGRIIDRARSYFGV